MRTLYANQNLTDRQERKIYYVLLPQINAANFGVYVPIISSETTEKLA